MSALDALKALRINLSFVADGDISKDRLAICHTCPRYSHGACLECGCIMLVKTKLTAEKCPLGKW